jgi:Golgi apparatus protein 1
MRVLKHHLAKSAVVLLLGCGLLNVAHAQSDITKSFADRLIEQATKLEKSCAKEMKKYCATVTPGEGRMIYCMQAHEDKISPGCSYDLQEVVIALQASNDALKEAANACRADIAAKCGKVQPGGGRIAACLVAEKSNVSKNCADAIDKVQNIKMQ